MQPDLRLEDFSILCTSGLFSGISEKELRKLLPCLGARRSEYGKGQTVLWQGDTVQEVGVVLSGRGRSLKTDLNGRQVLVTLLGPGSYVGVLLAASRERKSPVSVEAVEALSVLFLPMKRLFARCEKLCPGHQKLLENMLDGIAEKALVLHDRNDCLARSTIREKVWTFLERLSAEQRSREIVSPLDRQSMADYLGVERSALSRELGNMRREGLLAFEKDRFILLE